MANKQDEQLYGVWDMKWKGAESKEALTFIGRQVFKAKRKILTDVIKNIKVDTAIEVGCGLGFTMQVFQNLGLDCIGIDVSPYAVSACRRKGLRAELKKLEDITEQYDLVTSDGMLEHFINFQPYAEHLMRISRRYVLLIQPNHGSFWGKTLVYFAELLRGNENVFEYNYRINDFTLFFKNNGFFIEKDLPIFFDVFRLLLFKKT